MKYLKIENNKGFYLNDETAQIWVELDQISKVHLLKILEIAGKKEFEMDEYDDDLLQNPAHNILYKNIYNKLNGFLENKTRFQDSAGGMYKSAIEKYKVNEEDE